MFVAMSNDNCPNKCHFSKEVAQTIEFQGPLFLFSWTKSKQTLTNLKNVTLLILPNTLHFITNDVNLS